MKSTWMRRWGARWIQPVCGLLMLCVAVAQPIQVAEARALQEEFEQRYQRLSGMVEDLLAAQATMQKRLEALAGEVRGVRDVQGRRPADVVTSDELNRAIEGLRTAINKQREEDGRQVLDELKRINAAVAKLGDTSRRPAEPAAKPIPTTGYDYVVKERDTLIAIVQAYRDAGVKGLTVDLVLEANKGLKPERLIPGKTIFIPDPDKR
ncbi:MAG: LysM peptidoglycan-binding domain-containing protein [Verrucomicrobiae bacterium]|nr:LysM peptidoglycan-binding domain-containing protein [Verrucomicrobiae bacterium]